VNTVWRPTKVDGIRVDGVRAYLRETYGGEWQWNVTVPMCPGDMCLDAGKARSYRAARAAAAKVIAVYDRAKPKRDRAQRGRNALVALRELRSSRQHGGSDGT